MWYHSNKLTHRLDYTIFSLYGGQEQMQPWLCGNGMYLLNLRGGKTPLFCSGVLKPWACDDKGSSERRI